ncbi:hypothetical protein D3OALGA1CA_247 [Olavius algarvensis associated proteobacterium Delta 3]|nr:hypothetical protein D3OALGA1CA_247 [Olavius algarvensis associated proteobacterium Delta 3]CAB5098739.1 hypothetical protein D3OALGB2SA_1697 [Olavius algarvensis associated proteobacterium Delta 3]
MGLKKGFILKTRNPTVAVYGLTLYSSFLSSPADNLLLVTLFALLFALTAFGATSTRAIGEAAISAYLDQPRVRWLVNTVLVTLLVYCAIGLAGLTYGTGGYPLRRTPAPLSIAAC